jgi:hypothetical protein
MPDAYPLQWPIGRPRWTGARQPSQFKMTPSAMTTHLFEELDRLNAIDVIVSSNKRPYSRSEAEFLEDPGVAVYFKRKGADIAIACDKYLRLSDNLHAIGLAVEAFRLLERHGTGEMVDAAFRGFVALPETIIMGEHTTRPWHEVLQVLPDADWDVIDGAYKRLLHKVHPDKGGSTFAFQELQAAFKQAREERKI